MRSNKQILIEKIGNDVVFSLSGIIIPINPLNANDIESAMKQAQITILEEALAVGYKNNIAMLTGEIQFEPSMEAIILKLIKELES